VFESNREHAVQCRTQRLLTVVMGVAPATAADKEVDVGVGQRGDRPAVLCVVRPEVLVGLVVRTALRGKRGGSKHGAVLAYAQPQEQAQRCRGGGSFFVFWRMAGDAQFW
jgi:hypothetical protein